MDLNGKNLDGYLEDAQVNSPTCFPGSGSVNYFRRYKTIEEWLKNNVHQHVGVGALYKDGAFLTDHGPKHVATVIERASRLAESRPCTLQPYEVYLLLVAIQLHDAGNIFGRLGHEGRIWDILEQIGSVCGEDSTEKRCIVQIAQAHGGDAGGDKDTIGPLPFGDAVLGKTVRFRLLASTLRFADELADDRGRAASFMQNVGALPRKSEAYHRFASSLHSVIVNPNEKEVFLGFDVQSNEAKRTYGKGNGADVYLVDEILERTLKTHTERVYCSRFMRPQIDIETIRVKIEICDERNGFEVLQAIDYRLQEKGYPDKHPRGIYGVCEELNDWNGRGKIDGTVLHLLLDDFTGGT